MSLEDGGESVDDDMSMGTDDGYDGYNDNSGGNFAPAENPYAQLSDEQLIAQYKQLKAAQNPYAGMSDKELIALYKKTKKAESKDVSRETPKAEESTFDKVLTSLADNPVTDFAISAGQGATQAIADLSNLPQNIVRKTFGKKPYQFDTAGGMETKYPLVRQGAEIGTALALPLKGFGVRAKVEKHIPAAGKMVTKYLDRLDKVRGVKGAVARVTNDVGANIVAPSASYGAIFSANNPNLTAAEGATIGAVTGLPIGLGVKALGAKEAITNKIAESYRKQSRQKGSVLRTPEEAAKIVNAAEGVPIDLGTLIDAPTMGAAYRDYGAVIPGAKAKDPMQEIVGLTDEKAADLLDSLKGGKQPETFPYRLAANVESKLKKAEDSVGAGFKQVAKEADKAKIDFSGNKEEIKVAKRYLKSYRKSMAADKEHMFEDSDIALLEKIAYPKTQAKKEAVTQKIGGKKPYYGSYAGETPVIPEQITPTKERVSFTAVDEQRKTFGETRRSLSSEGNQLRSSIYRSLEKAAQKDIEASLKAAGREDLVRKWQQKRREHALTVVPLRSKSLSKMIDEKTNIENIGSALTAPQNRRAYSLLPKEAQDVAMYETITKGSQENTSAAKVAAKFEKMHPASKSRLLDAERAAKVEQIVQLNKIATKYRPILNQPQTGALAKNLGLWAGILFGGVSHPALVASSVLVSAMGARAARDPALIKAYLEGAKSTRKLSQAQIAAERAAIYSVLKSDEVNKR